MGQVGRPKDDRLAARRREQLLAAAADVFARHGYRDTDVQRIADAGKVAKGTVYLYFRSKEALFLAAVDRAMVRLREDVTAAADREADPLDRVAAAVRAYFQHFRDHPAHAELLIQERAEFRERKTPTYHDHRRANAECWRPVYAGLIRAGRVREMPIDRILGVVGDLVYGTMFTTHFTGRDRTADEQARDVLDVLFHGLLTPAEQARRSAR